LPGVEQSQLLLLLYRNTSETTQISQFSLYKISIVWTSFKTFRSCYIYCCRTARAIVEPQCSSSCRPRRLRHPQIIEYSWLSGYTVDAAAL